MKYGFNKNINELSGLSLVVGLGICHAIESVINFKDSFLQVKWPNDIILNNAKLGGILIESKTRKNNDSEIIIGIGINVNMKNASKKEIGQKWTSLYKETHIYHDRNIICAALINQLSKYLNKFIESKLSAFHEEWVKRDSLLNKRIFLKIGDETKEGVCVGINQNGHLLIKLDNNLVQSFSSSDIFLIK